MERNTTSLWLVSRPFLGFPYSFDKPLLEHPRTPQLASAWAQAWSHENLNIFIKHWTPTKSPFTFSLRREVTLLLGQVLDHSLDLVMALLRPGHKPAARGPTQPLRYLLALRHRVCLRQRHGINRYENHDIAIAMSSSRADHIYAGTEYYTGLTGRDLNI